MLWIIVIIFIFTDQISFQWPFDNNYNNNNEQWKNINQDFINITWILLSWPSTNIRNKRSQTLSQNNDFLYGWIYDISYNSAINWLRQQSQISPITLIVENAKYQQYGDDFKDLEHSLSNTNIILLPDEKLEINFTHAKTFVGDTRRAIQTANLNRTSFVENREHFFLSNNENIKKDLIKLFELDQQKITNPDSISKSDYQQFLDEASSNLLICPLNCRQKIEHLLHNAQYRIRISAQYVVDESLLNILIKQKNLDIRIRTNKNDSNRDLIRAIGQDKIIFEDKIYNHDKLLLIDDILIIGSMNLSDNALDHNREIGVILIESNFIKQVESLFQHSKFLQ